jgi:hypothetical protein
VLGSDCFRPEAAVRDTYFPASETCTPFVAMAFPLNAPKHARPVLHSTTSEKCREISSLRSQSDCMASSHHARLGFF